MIRKIVFYAVLVPLAIVVVLFAVANRQIVTVSFDPFSTTQPAFSLTMPLFALVFALVVVGVVIGGFAAWLRQSRHRRNARHFEAELRALQREVETLKARPAAGPDSGAAGDAARIAFHPPA